MKKVLIISYHFPPVNNIAARRFGGMVSYMPNFGWEPFVLTTNSKGDLPVAIPEENIIRIGENYDKGGVTSEEGYKGVPFFLKLPYYFYRKLGAEIVSIDRFIFSWGKELKRNKKIVRRINPDIIIGTCYPPVDIWMARFFSGVIQRPWVADLEDALSILNVSKIPLFKSLDEKIDRTLIKSASAVITLGLKLAEQMQNLYKRKIEIIYNGFDGVELNEDVGSINKKIKTIYYAGRFHYFRMPAIKLLIDWLAKDKRENLFIVIRSLGPKEANEEILRYAKEKGVYGRINLLPPASSGVVFQEEKEADILVSLGDLEGLIDASHGRISGKLMEYLPFRAPIVSINRPDSEEEDILKDTSRGYLASNGNQLDEAISAIFQEKKLNYFNWEKVKKYSREFQTKKLCEILDRIAI